MGVYKNYRTDQIGMDLVDMEDPTELSDILFVTLANTFDRISWKSRKYYDGHELYNGEFILGIDTPNGTFVRHFVSAYWSISTARELERCRDWDWKALRRTDRLLSLAKVI